MQAVKNGHKIDSLRMVTTAKTLMHFVCDHSATTEYAEGPSPD